MQDKTKINLVSSEIAGLWNAYMNDTLVVCMLKYFLNRVEDEEVRPILQYALNISNGHVQLISDIFNRERLPIPDGFKEDDVDINAPRLYTDPFYLFYMHNIAQFGMNNYVLILNHVGRPDIRDFFSKAIMESVELVNKATDVLQSQGLFIKAPRVEVPKTKDYVDNQNFLSAGWFGRRRPLLVSEITTIFASLRYHIIGGALITGFAQVAKTKKLKDYFFRGRDLTGKKIKELTEFFINETMPIPSTSDSFVTDSTAAPFSDKLMLFHITLLYAAKIGQDGVAFANALRHDLQAYYTGAMTETAKYAEDGLDMMIENRWLEQPPQAIEHRELVKT